MIVKIYTLLKNVQHPTKSNLAVHSSFDHGRPYQDFEVLGLWADVSSYIHLDYKDIKKNVLKSSSLLQKFLETDQIHDYAMSMETSTKLHSSCIRCSGLR